MALAAAGADVLAVEFDRGAAAGAARGVGGAAVGARPRRRRHEARLGGRARRRRVDDGGATSRTTSRRRSCCDLLEGAQAIRTFVVTVQREVGERLAAVPGDEHYGAVSVRVAYRATRERGSPRAAERVLAAPRRGVGRRAAGAARRSRRSTSTRRRSGASSTPGSPNGARRCGARWSGWAWIPGARTTLLARGGRRPARPRRAARPGRPRADRRGRAVSRGARSVAREAHAKLNVFLRVLGRREDGYHELESLVLPHLARRPRDSSTEATRSSTSRSVGDPAMAAGATTGGMNLALVAALALAEACGVSPRAPRSGSRSGSRSRPDSGAAAPTPPRRCSR